MKGASNGNLVIGRFQKDAKDLKEQKEEAKRLRREKNEPGALLLLGFMKRAQTKTNLFEGCHSEAKFLQCRLVVHC